MTPAQVKQAFERHVEEIRDEFMPKGVVRDAQALEKAMAEAEEWRNREHIKAEAQTKAAEILERAGLK